MHGPTREHVNGDPYQDDPRVVMPFNGMSPSGDVEADVVYANYGTPEDFDKLDKMKIDVRGKIVLVRYGQNFRGVKVFIAQERGAAGVIIYSDPCGRWLAPRRQISRRPVAARYRRAARLGGIHVRISRRSHHAGNRIAPVAARIATHFSGTIGADAENSGDSAFVSRCLAHSGASGRPGFAARVARRAAVYLSRRPGPVRSEDASEAGLSISHALGCDWPRARKRICPTSGWSRAIIATRGSSARSTPTAARRPCWKRCTASASC